MRISPTLLGGLFCFLALTSSARGEISTDRDVSLQVSPELTAAQPPPATELPLVPEPPAAQFPLTPGASREIRDDLPPLPTIDLTTQPDDLWQRLRNGFGMPDLQSPLVADRQAYYLNRPEMLKRILERSRRYLYHIVTELEKRGMPTELALLPIVESAFNPLAYSRARALGMWQFIPSTGKNYRLQQDGWVDRRRDIIASTSAALDYLQNIYEMNGDWQLALASYNWGEHAVARAIAKNQARGLPTDYLSLAMPGETRYYVPKLQALKNIIAQPDLFGIKLEPIPNRPYFGIVDVAADMDVSTAAKLAEIPLDEFIALNPAYHRPVIQGKDQSPLVLPTDKVAVFRANVERYGAEDKPLSNWSTYSLKKGEKLETVATRNGISVAKLKQLNGITARTKVGPGFALLVPRPGSQANPDLLAAYLPKAPGETPKGKHRGKKRKGAKGVSKHKPTGTKKPTVAGKHRRKG